MSKKYVLELTAEELEGWRDRAVAVAAAMREEIAHLRRTIAYKDEVQAELLYAVQAAYACHHRLDRLPGDALGAIERALRKVETGVPEDE